MPVATAVSFEISGVRACPLLGKKKKTKDVKEEIKKEAFFISSGKNLMIMTICKCQDFGHPHLWDIISRTRIH